MGSQSSVLERAEGHAGSDRSGSVSPFPEEPQFRGGFRHDHDAHSDDGIDGLPRMFSTMPAVPRAEAESPEERTRFPTLPEPPGRTKKKKPKRKIGLELEDPRDTYREQAPSAEPNARENLKPERESTIQEDSRSKKKKSKHRSKTLRHEADEPVDTQSSLAEPHTLSLSSQENPNRTQFEDLQEGALELPPLRTSDGTSSHKKKNKSRRRDKEQAKEEATSELAGDPISDNEEAIEIPSSMRSFKRRDVLGIGDSGSPRKRRRIRAESIEDSEIYPSQPRSDPLVGLIRDSQNADNRDDERQPDSEWHPSSINDNVKPHPEDDDEVVDESPALARQQRRGRASKQLTKEIAHKAALGASKRQRGALKPVPAEDDQVEPEEQAGGMDMDNTPGSDDHAEQTTEPDQEEGAENLDNPTDSRQNNDEQRDPEDESMQDVDRTDAQKEGLGRGGELHTAPESEAVAETENEGDDGHEEETPQDRPNEVDGAPNGQVPSPPVTEMDPRTSDQEMEERRISTPPRPSAKTPKSKSGTRRKAKTPFFDRGQDENEQAFAELPPNDAAATVKAKKPRRKPETSGRPLEAAAAASAPSRSSVQRTKEGDPVDGDAKKERARQREKERRERLKSQYKSGPLSVREQNQVCTAVEAVREYAGISQQEINAMIHENPRGGSDDESIHLFLWKTVEDACPSRPRQKLINWCRQRFHNFVARATWSEEQDEELRDMIRIHGHKWSVIGKLINRHQKDVRDRYRNYLVYEGKANTWGWTKEEEDKFYEAVENAVEAIRKEISPEKPDPKTVGELINWHQISEAMGFSRTRLQCLERWKRLRMSEALPNQITTKLGAGNQWHLVRARKDLQRMTGQEKYRLACRVRDTGATGENDVRWKKIATEEFEDKFQRQALVVAWGRLRETVPDWSDKTTTECAEYIVDMYEKDDAFLPDDRTEVSRSRATSTAPRSRAASVASRTDGPRSRAALAAARTEGRRSKTPSRRGSIRHEPGTLLSQPMVDPADDETDEENGPKAQNPAILTSGRTRGRGASEEVEESVLGDVNDRDVEMANGDDLAVTPPPPPEDDTQSTNEFSHPEEREQSPDLGFNAEPDAEPDVSSLTSQAAQDAEGQTSPERNKKHRESLTKKSKGQGKKGKRNSVQEPEETAVAAQGSPTPTNTPHITTTTTTTTTLPKKRRTISVVVDLPAPNGGKETPRTSTPNTGESPAKRRRRDLNPKTYTSVRAREQRAKLLGSTGSGRKRTSLIRMDGSDIENNSGDEEDDNELELPTSSAGAGKRRKPLAPGRQSLESALVAASSTPSKRVVPKGSSLSGGGLGSQSLTQSQSVPAPPPPSAQPEYADLSSDMDDMSDIPAEMPAIASTPIRSSLS